MPWRSSCDGIPAVEAVECVAVVIELIILLVYSSTIHRRNSFWQIMIVSLILNVTNKSDNDIPTWRQVILRANRSTKTIVFHTSPFAEFRPILPEHAGTTNDKTLLQTIRRGPCNQNTQCQTQRSLMLDTETKFVITC